MLTESGESRYLNFDIFPTEMLTEFLIRLPVPDIARASLVCKAWYFIISNPDFVDLHLKHSAKLCGYLYFPNKKIDCFLDSKIISSAIEKRREEGQKINMELRDDFQNPRMNSAGGLVAYTLRDDFCYVCNPFTGEEIKIAMGPFWGRGGSFMNWCGLGYSVASKEYKILLLSYTPLSTHSNGAIFTLGARSAWREIPYNIPYSMSSRGLDFEGRLFWLVQRYDDFDSPICIASFDVESETFKLWKSPNANMPVYLTLGNERMSLLSIGGTVALSELDRTGGNLVLRIWMLKDMINETWVNEINIAAPLIGRHVYKKMTIFGGCATNNTTSHPSILLSLSDSLIVYDAKDKRHRSLPSFIGKREKTLRRTWYIPHTQSFISPNRIMATSPQWRYKKTFDPFNYPSSLRIFISLFVLNVGHSLRVSFLFL